MYVVKVWIVMTTLGASAFLGIFCIALYSSINFWKSKSKHGLRATVTWAILSWVPLIGIALWPIPSASSRFSGLVFPSIFGSLLLAPVLVGVVFLVGWVWCAVGCLVADLLGRARDAYEALPDGVDKRKYNQSLAEELSEKGIIRRTDGWEFNGKVYATLDLADKAFRTRAK